MKGDDLRAEHLARALDGGPVADEIELLLPAVKRLREVLHRLNPDPDRVGALLPKLYEQHIAAASRPVVELAHPTLHVRDLGAALAFYRDALGLGVGDEKRGFATVDAGGSTIALHVGERTKAVGGENFHLEFRTDDLDRLVSALRRGGVPVDVRSDRARGRYAELRDPDGHRILVVGGSPAPAQVDDAASSIAEPDAGDE